MKKKFKSTSYKGNEGKKKTFKGEFILFRIPFTWYWVARVTPFLKDGVTKKEFCLATKRWSGEHYYWHFCI